VSAVPLALSALTALARDVLPDLEVVDGPIGGRKFDGDVLVIGWSDGATPSVLASLTEPDYGGRQREEGDVVCVADVYSGDADWPALRGRAEDVIGTLDQALQDRPGLDGALAGAWFGEAMEWTQADMPDGCSVRVAFAVHYVAL
jgi:hypothetical protein